MNGSKKDTPMSNLRSSSAHYFNQSQLSEEKLDRFEALLGTENSDKVDSQSELGSSSFSKDDSTVRDPIRSRSRLLDSRVKWAGFAASLLLFIGVILSQASSNLPLAIANEVAMNHIKMKPLEVKSQNLPALRSYFTELDFSVSGSKEFRLPQSRLLGGRYCSILGVSAAQIRYRGSDSDNKVTLYQVGYDKELYGELPNVEKGDVPKVMFVKGVKVRLWVEKGLLMAEASQG